MTFTVKMPDGCMIPQIIAINGLPNGKVALIPMDPDDHVIVVKADAITIAIG